MEAALLGIPHLVTHRVHWLSFEIIRRVARARSSSMLNLIADAGVVPERLQALARPGRLASVAARLLDDSQARTSMRQEMARAVERLGPPGAAERAADLVLQVAKSG